MISNQGIPYRANDFYLVHSQQQINGIPRHTKMTQKHTYTQLLHKSLKNSQNPETHSIHPKRWPGRPTFAPPSPRMYRVVCNVSLHRPCGWAEKFKNIKNRSFKSEPKSHRSSKKSRILGQANFYFSKGRKKSRKVQRTWRKLNEVP